MIIDNAILDLYENEKAFFVQDCFNPDDVISMREYFNHLNFRPAMTNARVLWLNWNENISWDSSTWTLDNNTWPVDVIDDFLNKYGLLLMDSSTFNKGVNSICRSIENASNFETDAHIFYSRELSWGLPDSFSPHWDHSHNFLLQIYGESLFTAWTDESSGPAEPRKGDPTDILFEEYLNPGDLVFFPRYSYHRIIPRSERLSISFPFDPRNNVKTGIFRDWNDFNAC